MDLERHDAVVESVRGAADDAIIAVPDDRLGHVIHLAALSDAVDEIVRSFNARVLPFERIRAVRRVAWCACAGAPGPGGARWQVRLAGRAWGARFTP